MFRRPLTSAANSIIILFILHLYAHRAFSILWCNEQQKASRVVPLGQPVNVEFKLEDEPQPGLCIAWTKEDSLPFNISVMSNTLAPCGRHNTSSSEDGNNEYEMSTILPEENGTGVYTLEMYKGNRSLCTIFVLNLTVETTEPICETLFDKDSEKLEMSCQWKDGDQASLVAGNQVLYEHVITEINSDGGYNISNKYSIFIPLKNIHDESSLPTSCIIFNSKTKRKNTCEFLTVERQFPDSSFKILNNQAMTFNCCMEKRNISLLPDYIFTEKSTKVFNYTGVLPTELTGASFLIFLCGRGGEGRGVSSVRLSRIALLNLERHETLNPAFLMETFQYSNGSNDFRCKQLTITQIHSSTLSPKTTQHSLFNCNSTFSSIEVTTAKSKSSQKDKIILISVALITSLAFVLSLVVHFGKYLYKVRGRKRYDRQTERNLSFRVNSPSTSAHMEAESVEMIESAGVAQTGQNRRTSDIAGHGRIAETVPSRRGRQARVPMLPTRHDALSTPCSRNVSNPGSPGSMAAQCLTETGCFPRGGDRKNVHDNIRSNVHPSASSLDNTFYSLDDVGGATTLQKVTDSLVVSQRFRRLKCPYDDQKALFTPVSENSSSSFLAGNRKTSSLTDSRPAPSADEEHLYAKPDISRKTTKMTASESDYDDPRDPGEEFWQRVLAKDKSLF